MKFLIALRKSSICKKLFLPKKVSRQFIVKREKSTYKPTEFGGAQLEKARKNITNLVQI